VKAPRKRNPPPAPPPVGGAKGVKKGTLSDATTLRIDKDDLLEATERAHAEGRISAEQLDRVKTLCGAKSPKVNTLSGTVDLSDDDLLEVLDFDRAKAEWVDVEMDEDYADEDLLEEDEPESAIVASSESVDDANVIGAFVQVSTDPEDLLSDPAYQLFRGNDDWGKPRRASESMVTASPLPQGAAETPEKIDPWTWDHTVDPAKANVLLPPMPSAQPLRALSGPVLAPVPLEPAPHVMPMMPMMPAMEPGAPYPHLAAMQGLPAAMQVMPVHPDMVGVPLDPVHPESLATPAGPVGAAPLMGASGSGALGSANISSFAPLNPSTKLRSPLKPPPTEITSAGAAFLKQAKNPGPLLFGVALVIGLIGVFYMMQPPSAPPAPPVATTPSAPPVKAAPTTPAATPQTPAISIVAAPPVTAYVPASSASAKR
jgi:hypothetical protein